MHLKTASPFLPITSLSGGNQQKAVLAKMLMAKPKVLILDEPTRGVDVGAKYEIYKLMGALAAEGVAIIMVSSELAEVLGVSNRVLVIGDGQLRGVSSTKASPRNRSSPLRSAKIIMIGRPLR